MFQTNHIVANYRRPTFEGLQHKIDNKGIKLDDKTPHYLIFKQPISIFTPLKNFKIHWIAWFQLFADTRLLDGC